MPVDKDRTITILNNLIATCKDGEGGYRVAAEHVQNHALKTMFESYAGQRESFATALQHAVRNLGGDPEQKGTVAGALLHGWASIKAVVTGGNQNAIISECQRSEAITKQIYEDALKEELPEEVRALIEQQLVGVKEAHERIRALEVIVSQMA